MISRRPLSPILLLLTLTGCITLRAPIQELSSKMPTKVSETNNPRRLIVIATADVPRLGEVIPFEEDFIVADSADEAGTTVHVATRAVQVEWLRMAGMEILSESEHVPLRYLDPTFAERSARGPVDDGHGGFITDDGYRDSAMNEALLRAYAGRFPAITRLHEIGRTWQDRPILALLITDNPDEEEGEPALFFNGLHHSSELLSPEPVIDMIEYLTERYATDPQVRRWVDSHEIWCVPVVNPDGLDLQWHMTTQWGRKNARDLNGDGILSMGEGVDLNRNYPFMWAEGGDGASSGEPDSGFYRGPSPASEPEIQAVMRLADEQRFVMSITYHTSATRILVPYSIDGAINPEPSVAWAMAAEILPLVESTRPERPYRTVRQLYAVDGTDQDWHYFAHGTEAFLVELPRHNPDFATERNPICDGIRPMWMYLLDRLERGPTITGWVFDAETREPLEAVISLDEIHWSLGERHTSHPVTGRFDRILPITGTYHVRAECEGYEPALLEVQVIESERIEVPVALRRQPDSLSD